MITDNCKSNVDTINLSFVDLKGATKVIYISPRNNPYYNGLLTWGEMKAHVQQLKDSACLRSIVEEEKKFDFSSIGKLIEILNPITP